MTGPDAPAPVRVVGIGADGWAGLTEAARESVRTADVVLGGPRQLALVTGRTGAELRGWPSPLLPALPGLLAELAQRRLTVLASGDPMFHGIGATLARLLGPGRIEVCPHPSSVALACARMGWASHDVEVVSLVARPLAGVRRALAPDRPLLVLSGDADDPRAVAELLTADGWGPSELTVLEQLGGPGERRRTGLAATWAHPPGDPLNVLAVRCRAAPGTRPPAEAPGLPDDAYAHDGQLTKWEVRAVTVAALAPRPGEVLWDVGAGNGSVAVEWLRSHRSCAAVAIESHPERADRIAANAAALGVPGLRVVRGRAPAALADLPAPDAVFVGGGVTLDGVLDACWAALRPGGRLVANAVTVQAETVLAGAHQRHGGRLIRLSVARAGPLGGFTGWRPAMPVTVWVAERGGDAT